MDTFGIVAPDQRGTWLLKAEQLTEEEKYSF